MKLNFNKITYEDDLADFSEEELQELIGEFETAQESNVAEFEKAAEATEKIDDSTIEDFETARDELVEEIVSADTFDEVPLTEAMLEEEDFSDLQDWRDFVTESEEVEEETENKFDNMGKEAPVNGEDDSEDFADKALQNMQGLNL